MGEEKLQNPTLNITLKTRGKGRKGTKEKVQERSITAFPYGGAGRVDDGSS
jgi:hypothetical protein